MIFKIETGNYRAQQKGSDAAEAVVAAFKKRPPKNAGTLTRACWGDTPWLYVSTAAMLEKAGYPVNGNVPR